MRPMLKAMLSRAGAAWAQASLPMGARRMTALGEGLGLGPLRAARSRPSRREHAEEGARTAGETSQVRPRRAQWTEAITSSPRSANWRQ